MDLVVDIGRFRLEVCSTGLDRMGMGMVAVVEGRGVLLGVLTVVSI